MKKAAILLILLALAGALYYGASPLFDTVVVNDPLPQEPQIPQEFVDLMNSEGGAEHLSREERTQMEDEMDEVNRTPMEPENVVMISMGGSVTSPIMHTIGHPAEGEVRVLHTKDGTIVRFENFKTINGPRLHIYLAKDLKANEFYDLGPIRATEGNINYVVPEDVDIKDYKYVMHWCVPFGVLFNFAELKVGA